MDALSPPEVNTEEVGRNPENPLFAIETSHQKLSDTIGRICYTITERASTVDAFIGVAHPDPNQSC